MPKRIFVVCEHVLKRQCSRDNCPAYKKNEIGLDGCKKFNTGRYYYVYSCSTRSEDVKLLDINWSDKPDPNLKFLEKMEEEGLDF